MPYPGTVVTFGPSGELEQSPCVSGRALCVTVVVQWTALGVRRVGASDADSVVSSWYHSSGWRMRGPGGGTPVSFREVA